MSLKFPFARFGKQLPLSAFILRKINVLFQGYRRKFRLDLKTITS